MKMNVYYSFLFLLISLASCSRSPEEKAISAIVHHLEKNLSDPASYIPVDFLIMEERNRHLNNTPDAAKASTSHLPATSDSTSTGARMRGWKILHKFRCRSESGLVKDTQLMFFINKQYRIEKLQ